MVDMTLITDERLDRFPATSGETDAACPTPLQQSPRLGDAPFA
jgi:hypothetical protein